MTTLVPFAGKADYKNGEKMVDLAKNAYPELEWEVEDGGNFEQFNSGKKGVNDVAQKK